MTQKITWFGIFLVVAALFFSQILGSFSMFLLVKGTGLKELGSFSALQSRMILQFAFLNFYYFLSLPLLEKALHFRLKLKENIFGNRYHFTIWIGIILTGVSYQFVGSEFENSIAEFTGRTPDATRMIHEIAGMPGVMGFVLATLFIAIFPPIFEEIFFRHILQRGLTAKYGFNIAVIITSLVFAVIHVNLSTMLPIFILSLVLGSLYEKYNLLASIVLHASVNFSVVLFVRFQSEITGLNVDQVESMEHMDTSELLLASIVFASVIMYLFRERSPEQI